MTTDQLHAQALPVAYAAAKAALPFPLWALLKPWLPLLVKIAIEIAVGLLAPPLLPLVAALLGLEKFLSAESMDLLRTAHSVLSTPRESMSEPVQRALDNP